MSKEVNECLTCDAYDPDLGCTIPSIDRSYACPYEENDEELEKMLQSLGVLPGQTVIFRNEDDDYPY